MIDAVLTKRFGSHEVLTAASLSVRSGTVHALVGENGAGKSTLVKIIAGVLRGDAGTLAIGGAKRDAATWTRQAARAAGIGIVQQHGAFAGTLSVVENAMLGVEPMRGPLLDLDASAKALSELGEKVGLPIDPLARAEDLTLGAAQRAEIVAALHHGARFLILDEPTAVLTPVEVDGLLERLRALAASGTTVVIVTHKLDEVRAVADDVTVLRAGKTVKTFTAHTGELYTPEEVPPRGRPAMPEGVGSPPRFEIADIARAMVGTDLPAPSQVPPPAGDAPVALTVKALAVAPALLDVSIAVRSGEIVGVAGVDGNGQRELALAIAGLTTHRGTVAIGKADVTRARPAARLGAGLAHIPEDRHEGGLVLDATVTENLVLGRTDITGRFNIDRSRVRKFVDAQIKALDIRPPNPTAIVGSMSGGNQQKVVVGRELSRPGLVLVLASQPTRGVDLGAVLRIHDQLRAAARAGAGVLVISADLDELLQLCHRVVVLLRGKIVGEKGGETLRAADARDALGRMMTGASEEAA